MNAGHSDVEASPPAWNRLGFMAVGAVPADWRSRRTAVRARVGTSARFLDVEAHETREELGKMLAAILRLWDYGALDVSVIRGADRRVTRLIAQAVHTMTDQHGDPAFDGIPSGHRRYVDICPATAHCPFTRWYGGCHGAAHGRGGHGWTPLRSPGPPALSHPCGRVSARLMIQERGVSHGRHAHGTRPAHGHRSAGR